MGKTRQEDLTTTQQEVMKGEKRNHTSAALSHKGSKSLLYNANGDLKPSSIGTKAEF